MKDEKERDPKTWSREEVELVVRWLRNHPDLAGVILASAIFDKKLGVRR